MTKDSADYKFLYKIYMLKKLQKLNPHLEMSINKVAQKYCTKAKLNGFEWPGITIA
jgi:hypothetical protein